MKYEKNYQTKPLTFGGHMLQFVFSLYRRKEMGTKFLHLF